MKAVAPIVFVGIGTVPKIVVYIGIDRLNRPEHLGPPGRGLGRSSGRAVQLSIFTGIAGGASGRQCGIVWRGTKVIKGQHLVACFRFVVRSVGITIGCDWERRCGP